GTDRSLDRCQFEIAATLDPASEHAGGNRAHDPSEVDLNPHHAVGPPLVLRLELHPPPRRGRAHRPGERHAARGLDNGHLLAPLASRSEDPLRPLLNARTDLKRIPSANPTFENRRGPLRPAFDVTHIRPHLRNAAGDCY